MSGFHPLSVVLLFHAAPSTHKVCYTIWVVVVYFKCACISSLFGTPPPPFLGWDWNTLTPWWVFWLVWGPCFPFPSGSSQEEDLLEEPLAVPPGPAQAGGHSLRLSLPTQPTCLMMSIPKNTSTGSWGSAQHHLCAARDLKPELLRAEATAYPSLLALAGMAFIKWEALAWKCGYVSLVSLSKLCSCLWPRGRLCHSGTFHL